MKRKRNAKHRSNMKNKQLFRLYRISHLKCHGYVLGVLQSTKNEQRFRNARQRVIVGVDTEYPWRESQRCFEISEAKRAE